jgi:hypothetical protein
MKCKECSATGKPVKGRQLLKTTILKMPVSVRFVSKYRKKITLLKISPIGIH